LMLKRIRELPKVTQPKRWASTITRVKKDSPYKDDQLLYSTMSINGQTVTVQTAQTKSHTPLHREQSGQLSLKTPLPGYDSVATTSTNHNEKWPTSVSRLNNGMRIVTQNAPSPACAVSLLVDAGTQYETEDNHGVTHLLERMSFQSTQKMSSKDLVAELETLGGNITTSTQRDFVTYTCESLPQNVQRIVEVLSDITLRPALLPEEVESHKAGILEDIEMTAQEKPGQIDPYLSDIIHNVAYNNQPLGRPLSSSPEAVQILNSEKARQYQSKLYVPSRMILAVAGCQHDDVVNMANQYFDTPSPSEYLHPPKSVWTGGSYVHTQDESIQEQHLHFDEEDDVDGTRRREQIMSHAVLAFENKGTGADETFSLAILLSLFGGGGSFSAGGPGKGMYSRLYRNVLNGYASVESVQSFTSNFSDTGIFGVHGTCQKKDASLNHIQAAITEELVDVVHNLKPEEYQRAQNQAKSTILMALESRTIVADDLARQILLYGKRYTAEEIVHHIDHLSITDIQNNLARMLCTNPVLVLSGSSAELSKCASHGAIKSWIQQKIRPQVL